MPETEEGAPEVAEAETVEERLIALQATDETIIENLDVIG